MLKVIVSALFLTACTSGALGAPMQDDVVPSPIGETFRAHIEQLEDPAYARREAASRFLLEAVPRSDLLDLVQSPDLTSEQRHRLLWIFRQQLFEKPRGAVGIRMEPTVQPGQFGPVRIAELLPGLPAERVLEVGDIITHVDGKSVTTSEQLILEVQLKAPGEIVKLTVKRPCVDDNGREVHDEKRQIVTTTMEVDLQLGSADMLIDERTGQTQRGGPVDRRRAQQADEVVRRFGPKAKTLTVQGDPDVQKNDEPDDLEVLAEQHIAVRTILAERNAIDDGRLSVSRPLEERWRRQLAELREILRQPDLSPLEREYMRRVCERYKALMGD